MAVPTVLKTLFFPFYLLFAYIFIVSGVIVVFLMFLTYIFVWAFDRHLYRKIIMHIAYTLWSQFTFLAQWWSESDIKIYLENEEDFKKLGKEHVIVLMNHKYDIDWLLSWVLAERYGLLGGTKVYGKSSLKMVPIIGWAWIFTENIFLRREWDKDKKVISRDLSFMTDYPDDYWITLLLFCEGTRFTEEKHKQSLEIARKKGLPELKHHLLPRTKGFVHSMHGVRGKIPAILDITMVFDEKKYARPTLLSVLQGKKCQAEAFIRRIPTDSIPIDTDEACADWLQKLFKEKDDIYDYYMQHGTFKTGKKYSIPRRAIDLTVWVLWALLLSMPLVYYIIPLIVSASLTVKIVTLLVLSGLYKGLKAMIEVSQTEKGSSYGNVSANGKKTQ